MGVEQKAVSGGEQRRRVERGCGRGGRSLAAGRRRREGWRGRGSRHAQPLPLDKLHDAATTAEPLAKIALGERHFRVELGENLHTGIKHDRYLDDRFLRLHDIPHDTGLQRRGRDDLADRCRRPASRCIKRRQIEAALAFPTLDCCGLRWARRGGRPGDQDDLAQLQALRRSQAVYAENLVNDRQIAVPAARRQRDQRVSLPHNLLTGTGSRGRRRRGGQRIGGR